MPSPAQPASELLVHFDRVGASPSPELRGLIATATDDEDHRAALAELLAARSDGGIVLREMAESLDDPAVAILLTEVEGLRRAAVRRQLRVLNALSGNTDTIVAEVQVDGTIGFCNAATTAATGLTRGDSLVKFAASFNAEDLARVQAELAAGAASVGWSVGLDQPDGPHHYDFTMTPSYDGDGELLGFSLVGYDVSELRRAEAAMDEQNAFLRSVLQSTSEAIIVIDAEATVLYMNPIAERIFGYLEPAHGLIPDAADIIAVDGEPPSVERLPLERALKGEENVFVEMLMEGPGDGVIVSGIANPMRSTNGEIIGAVGVYRDVTEAKAAAVAEEASRAFTLEMLSTLEEPVVALNVLTDEDYLNDAARRLDIPGPGVGAPMPFTTAGGQPLDPDLLFNAMAGDAFEGLELHHPESGRVFLGGTRAVSTEAGVLGAVFTATDITELRGAMQQLELQGAAMESTVTSMVITDVTGSIQWVNPAFTRISGFTEDEAIGKTPNILRSTHHTEAFFRDLWDTILSGTPWHGRIVNLSKFGVEYTVEQWITPIFDHAGEITHFVAVQEDISAQVAAEAQVLHMATHDVLTDLPNRRLLLEHLEQAIARARRADQQLAVMMLDLDRFKAVNDAHGHHGGDQLLREVAKRLSGRIRESDVVGRLGGDEFAIILEDTDLAGARHLAEDLIGAIAVPFDLLGQQVTTGTSIGIAPFETGIGHAQMFDRADMALYEAKRGGRGALSVYDERLGEASRTRVVLGQQLRSALDTNQLRLAYQLVFDVESGLPTSVEALLRWDHPDGRVLHPDSFIKAAADHGLLPDLGRWVMNAVCLQVKLWKDAELDPPPVSVNVAPGELRDPKWPEAFAATLARWDVEVNDLAVELDEEAVIAASDQNLLALRDLRETGLNITLDDFGTGYSSMLHFRRMPLNRIKLARIFTADVTSGPASAAIIRASAVLADSLGARLVAKGVERQDQLHRVANLGCQEIQGFVVEEALSPTDVAKHFNRRHKVFGR